uniref:ATP synthase complex subunit 8 n=1 Tax=Cerambycidae sp. 8 KM-2017 TaxID=2219293 RepID=A0A346RGM5_9CUCU|nr:ATP synthase F0 subunit 8 [Cerambycidae sp. 8 KM-2017]
MPQMAPLNWLILFIFFILIFIIFNIMNYYIMNLTPEQKKITKSSKLINWSW